MEQLSDDLVAQFGTAVFIHDSLVVHRARSAAPPLLADANIAELPDVHARTILKGEDDPQLLTKRLCLKLLAPFGRIGAAVAVQPARADLRHQKGLARALRLPLYPVVQVGKIFFRGRIVIPFGIDIVGDNLGQPEADVRLELAARKGAGTAPIERADARKLLLVAELPVFAVARALIEDAPDIDARVVVVLGDHLARDLERLPLKIIVLTAAWSKCCMFMAIISRCRQRKTCVLG